MTNILIDESSIGNMNNFGLNIFLPSRAISYIFNNAF